MNCPVCAQRWLRDATPATLVAPTVSRFAAAADSSRCEPSAAYRAAPHCLLAHRQPVSRPPTLPRQQPPALEVVSHRRWRWRHVYQAQRLLQPPAPTFVATAPQLRLQELVFLQGPRQSPPPAHADQPSPPPQMLTLSQHHCPPLQSPHCDDSFGPAAGCSGHPRPSHGGNRTAPCSTAASPAPAGQWICRASAAEATSGLQDQTCACIANWQRCAG